MYEVRYNYRDGHILSVRGTVHQWKENRHIPSVRGKYSTMPVHESESTPRTNQGRGWIQTCALALYIDGKKIDIVFPSDEKNTFWAAGPRTTDEGGIFGILLLLLLALLLPLICTSPLHKQYNEIGESGRTLNRIGD